MMKKMNGKEKEEFSIKYQILDKSTSLIVAEKVVEKVSNSIQFKRIPIVVNKGEQFTITVRTLMGKGIVLEVGNMTTIEDLKNMI
jgi:hypothetical protein